jgi:hypothetical protein
MRIRFSAQRSIAPTLLPACAAFCRLGILPLLLIGLTIGVTGQAKAQAAPQPPNPSAPQAAPQPPALQPSSPPAPQAAPQPPSLSAPVTPPAPPMPPAPPELTQALTQIDAAANQHNLRAVMRFYSPNFTSTDGLSVTDMQAALKSLWELYPNLTYSTRINSWTQEGNAIVAETTTTITSPAITSPAITSPAVPSADPAPVQRSRRSANNNSANNNSTEAPSTGSPSAEAPPAGSPSAEANTPAAAPRPFALTATLISRQRFENQKIVQQEILSERTQMTAGENPPTIDVNLPQQVGVGQSFDFDASVREPLGDRLLLGAALEEPISTTGYLNPTPVNLEPLSAGGIFKVGQAPITPESRWISAVIIRDDGITTVTQRLQVSPSSTTPSATPSPSGAPPSP